MRSRGALAVAFHALARRPAFTAAVALTLGLGVGANLAVFSLLDAALLRALPYPEADRLVLVWEARPERGWSRLGVSSPAYRDWCEQVTSLQHVVAFYEAQANLADAAVAERINVLHASADLLPALGLYGVLAQLARERAREFGVRLALGARPVQVSALVLGGGPAARGPRRSLRRAGSPRVRPGAPGPVDPLALAGTAGLLVAAATAASLPSVLRTARLDPSAVLRDE